MIRSLTRPNTHSPQLLHTTTNTATNNNNNNKLVKMTKIVNQFYLHKLKKTIKAVYL